MKITIDNKEYEVAYKWYITSNFMVKYEDGLDLNHYGDYFVMRFNVLLYDPTYHGDLRNIGQGLRAVIQSPPFNLPSQYDHIAKNIELVEKLVTENKLKFNKLGDIPTTTFIPE